MSIKDWVLLGLLGAVALVGAVFVLPLVPAWITARRAGVKVEFVALVGMRLRKTPVRRVLGAGAAAKRGGVSVKVSELESQAMAGGDAGACVDAMEEGKRRGVRAEWDSVRACELVGSGGECEAGAAEALGVKESVGSLRCRSGG